MFIYQQDIFANRATFVRLLARFLLIDELLLIGYMILVAIRRIANTRTVLYVISYPFARDLKIACYLTNIANRAIANRRTLLYFTNAKIEISILDYLI